MASLYNLRKKSQYSVEFLIFFGILFTLFIFWLAIYGDLTQQAFQERENKAIADLGKSIQLHIFAASTSHSGYYSDALVIPDKVLNLPIKVILSSNSFSINAKGADFPFTIPYTMYGDPFIQGKKIGIWNLNGVVFVGECAPIVDDNGNVGSPQCSNGIDDEDIKDELVDEEDGNCWSGNPPNDIKYDCSKNDESEGGLYAYYFVCKNAEEQGFCSDLKEYFCQQINCCDGTDRLFCCTDPCNQR
jgi:hypothetical protein